LERGGTPPSSNDELSDFRTDFNAAKTQLHAARQQDEAIAALL
jgi:hypothetical protein